jgi:hypothetical protein
MAEGLSVSKDSNKSDWIPPFNISKVIWEATVNRPFALPMGYMPIPVHTTNVTTDKVT